MNEEEEFRRGEFFILVPLAMVGNLMARLVNSSSLSISWILPENAHELLHGQFRTFIVSIYENFSTDN